MYWKKWKTKKKTILWFLVFELWSIWNVKKRDQNFFFRPISIKKILGTIAGEREPVPMRVLNPKACGVQGRSPGGGCGGGKAPLIKMEEKKISTIIFVFSLKYIFFLLK